MTDTGAGRRVSVLGATSLVGACLLPLLTQAGWQVTAYSRRAPCRAGDGVAWRQIEDAPSPLAPFRMSEKNTPDWICVAPIWVLPDYFALLEAQRARRLVALSSTSRFSKDDSSDPAEQTVARRLAEAEARVQAWAEGHGVEWVILRPTLIYGLGRDKNISEIARLIRRFGFFPLLGRGMGLRQPIHVTDIAVACFSVLTTACARNRDYNISGAETLPYREMVSRVFAALGRRPRFLVVPLGVFKFALIGLRLFPRYRHWTIAMAERINRDLVFDHCDAVRDWGFLPSAFQLTREDVAKK